MTSLLRDIRANSFVTLSLSRDITTVSSPLKTLSSQKKRVKRGIPIDPSRRNRRCFLDALTGLPYSFDSYFKKKTISVFNAKKAIKHSVVTMRYFYW
jgi:hypothetical protein